MENHITEIWEKQKDRGETLVYYIGIDGGEMKTAICVANTDNAALHYTKTRVSLGGNMV